MRLIIVDGYNLLYSRSSDAHPQSDLRAARESFLSELSTYGELSGDRIVVIFDGTSEDKKGTRERRWKNVEVRYTRKGQEADDMIRQLARTVHRGDVQIITTDRKLAQSLRTMGVTVRSNGTFERTVQQTQSAWSPTGFDQGFGKSIAERIDRKSWDALKKLRAKLIADGHG